MLFKCLVVATLVRLVVGAPPPLILATPEVEFDVDGPIGSLSRTPDGRTFFNYVMNDGTSGNPHPSGPSLVEFFEVDGTTKPYPHEGWYNAPLGDNDPDHRIIGVSAQRIGPDGHLYALDTGIPHLLVPAVPGGAKLMQIDVESNTVANIWDLSAVVSSKPSSFLADFRFNGNLVYITDLSAPSIIILDLSTGVARRVLQNTPSTKASFPLSAEGHLVRLPDNSAIYTNSIYLEVSPDARYLYFQPGMGGLRRIETQYLKVDGPDDDATLESHVEPFALTPSSGGTAIDAEGNLYSSDIDWQRIIKISPSGQQTVIAQDARLLHSSLWIDSSNRLFISASQHNRAPMFNHGQPLFDLPFHVFSIDIGIGPSPIDHD